MNWEFAEACYEESSFCAENYDRDLYWRYMKLDDCWYELYLMGGEL